MPVDVVTTTEIARSREEVAGYAMHPDNATRWYANIQAVEWETPPPLRLGSRLTFVARFLGRRLVYTYEVEQLVAGELLVMSTSQGPFPMETTYRFEDAAGGGTWMTLRNRGEPKGFGRVAGPVMERAMRSANRKDLARIKQILDK